MIAHQDNRDANTLNICVIGSTYPRHEDDYAVPWLRESVARLVARGHRVTVLAPSYQGLQDHAIDGVPVHRFRYAPQRWERLTHEQGAPNRIRNPLYQVLGVPYVVRGRRAARRLAHGNRFDLVHAHWPFPHEFIATIAAQTCDAPLVMTCHGAEFALARRKKWVHWLLAHSLRKANLLIANSNDTAAQIRRVSGCDSLLLPFGSTVAAKPSTPPINPIPRLLFTGRLIQRKGVEYLLRAMPHLLQQQRVQLVITGDGDERGRLEALASKLNIQRHVSFLGFVSNERLNAEYARCDVWINPSIVDDRGDTEGLGVGSIEAYAHGKPVVASAVGGIPDTVVHGETGFLVPEKNEHELAQAILSLINDRQLREQFGQAGLQFAQRKFNWDRITDQLEQAYWRVLTSHRLRAAKGSVRRSRPWWPSSVSSLGG